MKYSRSYLLSFFCLVIAGLLPALSSYGWQGVTQAAQDAQDLRKQAAVTKKRMLQQLVLERRNGRPVTQATLDGTTPSMVGPCDPGMYPAIQINVPQAGQLVAGDCPTFIGDGTLADIYTFTSTEPNQQIAISLGSTAFDAYLYLCDSNGTIITQDDDGGGSTNARIPANSGFFTLSAQGTTYWIVVNTLLAGQVGNYQLSVYNGLQFYPLSMPIRLLDTRVGFPAYSQPNAPITGQTSRTQKGRDLTHNGITIPPTALALTGNVTSRQSGGAFLTFYPSDAPLPLAATINFNANEVMNNVFTVGLGLDGAFNIFAYTTTDVVVDVTGYYAPPGTGGLYFHPLPTPVRLLETRLDLSPNACFRTNAPFPATFIRVQNGRNTCGIPATAQALVGNVTTVAPTVVAPTEGFLTLYPYATSPPPGVTSSTYNTGDTMNAQFIVKLTDGVQTPSNGFFNIYTSSNTDLVVDVLGYYSADATDANGQGLLFSPLPSPVRLLETRVGQLGGCSLPAAPLLAQSTRTQAARGFCMIPNNAQGLIGNATTVNPGAGFFTFYPSSVPSHPEVATSNFVAGQILNRHFTVGLGNADGAFKIFTYPQIDLVIDVSGYFAP